MIFNVMVQQFEFDIKKSVYSTIKMLVVDAGGVSGDGGGCWWYFW